MSHIRHLFAASVLAFTTAGHAASDAEVGQWLNEVVGSVLVLQELAAGHCSEFMRDERTDVQAWYSWAASLASPAARAGAEQVKAQKLAQARTVASQWIADEFRSAGHARGLQKSCAIYTGVFRTIRDAAESELENIEFKLRGSVTPRAQR